MLILILLFTATWSIYIYFVVKDKRLFGFYFKGFTSFLFILTFGYGFYKHFLLNNPLSIPANDVAQIANSELKFAILIFVGLVAGLIGDLFLEMMHSDKTKDKHTIIAFGTIVFLIGHLFYIAGLTIIGSFSYISIIIGLVMTIIVYIGSKVLKLKMGKLEILIIIYTLVIFIMIGQAIMNAFYLEFNTFSVVFMIGAILFGISDLLLAPIYFGDKETNPIVVANLSTYYFGQLLIALAIYFL